MPDRHRSLPERPNLRFLKLEAKRRVAAGEFGALHEAQDAVAREHGLTGWAELKRVVDAPGDSPALDQFTWVVDRFRDAAAPGWSAPGEAELREHVSDALLAELPPARLVATASRLAPVLGQERQVRSRERLSASVQLADLRFDVAVDDEPPHRLTMLRAVPATRPARDRRLMVPPTTSSTGPVPPPVSVAAAECFGSLGLAGLVLAGASEGAEWVHATGWADLEQDARMTTGLPLPLPGVTALVTATAVLRLVAEGRLGLDAPANAHLAAVRLADDTVTVRELLLQTGGVADPDPAGLYGSRVPPTAELLGPVVGIGPGRGTRRPSNGGYAVLGQLIADVTGTGYAEAVDRLVLSPLGVTSAVFPTSPAQLGPVVGYDLTPGGDLTPAPAAVCAIPAAGGMWATASDVLRLALGWPSLLPADLAREAVTAGGLGWLVSPRGDLAVHAGAGGGATASLVLRLPSRRVLLAVTNRVTPLEPVNAAVLKVWRP